MIYGYLGKNFDQKQIRVLILEYAQGEQLLVGDFLDSENLLSIKSGDILLVPNLSYFGLNIIKSLSVCVSLGENGVQIHFIEQSGLSICGDKLSDRLATFRAMLDSERGFISARAMAGMKVAKAKGVKLGRPKGPGKIPILDNYQKEIVNYLKKGVSVVPIMKVINSQLDESISYFRFKRYVEGLGVECK